MTGFAVNSYNDLYLNESGNLTSTNCVAEIIQSITSSLLLWLKEYDFDTTLGINYRDLYANPHLNSATLDYYIMKAIMLPNQYLTADNLSVYGVNKINSLNYALDQSNRKININAEIMLNNGQILTIKV